MGASSNALKEVGSALAEETAEEKLGVGTGLRALYPVALELWVFTFELKLDKLPGTFKLPVHVLLAG